MALHADLVFFWSPRLAGIGFAGLLAVLSAGTFEGSSLCGMLTALLLQLTPSILALTLLVVAWQWEPFGAVVFPLLGALFLVVAGERGPSGTTLLLPVMLFLVGFLFLGDWVHRRHLVGRH